MIEIEPREHRLFRRHPRKPGLELRFCSLQRTERILELPDEAADDRESAAVLETIFDEFLYTDENRYRHEWTVGDLGL